MKRRRKKIGSKLNKRTVEQKAKDLIDIARLAADGKSSAEILEFIKHTRPYTLGRTQIFADINQIKENWKNSAVSNYEERRAESEQGMKQDLSRALDEYEKSRPTKKSSGDPRFLAIAVRIRDLMNRMNDLYPRTESPESTPTGVLPAGIIVIPGYSPEKPAPELPPDIKQIIDIK